MKINMKVAFIFALIVHAIIIAVLLVRVSLDKPSKPNMGNGDLMHATFVPPAKGKPSGAKQKKVELPVEDKQQAELEQQKLKQQQEQKQLEESMKKLKALEEQKQAELALKKQKL